MGLKELIMFVACRAVVCSAAALLGACTLPNTYQWVQEGWPVYADGYVVSSIIQMETRQGFAALGKESEHTTTFSKTYKVAMPADGIDKISTLQAFAWVPDSVSAETYLRDRGIRDIENLYHPWYAISANWQDRHRLNFKHPTESRILLNMTVDEEREMYRALEISERTIDHVINFERLGVGASFKYYYDMDGQYLLFAPRLETVNGPDNEFAMKPRFFKVFYYEYLTGKYGAWLLPIAYKNPEEWDCSSVVPRHYLSKKQEKIAVTLFGCEPKNAPADWDGLAVIHNLETGETFEAPIPAGFGNYYTFSFETNSFYDFRIAKTLDKNSPNWMQPEAQLIVLDVEKNQAKHYAWPITYIEHEAMEPH